MIPHSLPHPRSKTIDTLLNLALIVWIALVMIGSIGAVVLAAFIFTCIFGSDQEK